MLALKENAIRLPENLRGRNLHENIIPTVYNLRNTLQKLDECRWDYTKLKQWEKRSYRSYHIDSIENQLRSAGEGDRIKVLRDHILSHHPTHFGPNCMNIYLVGAVAENYGTGRETFFEYVKQTGISEKINSSNAIWTVGKGDGDFLNILHRDGSVKDWDFIAKWVKGKSA